MRQKLVQRRVQQPDRHRQASHDGKQFLEITSLHRQQFGKCRFAANTVCCHDHLAHRDNTVNIEEHMLCPAQANALSSEINGRTGICRRLCVGAHRHSPSIISPGHHRCKSTRHFRLNSFDTAGKHFASATINGDDVAFAQLMVADIHLAACLIKAQIARTRYAGPSHAARNNSRMARHTAARRQDTGSRMHAVDIFRAGLKPHKDHLLATSCQLFGAISTQHNFTRRRPRRCRQTLRQHSSAGIRVQCRVQQLIQRHRIKTQQRLITAD